MVYVWLRDAKDLHFHCSCHQEYEMQTGAYQGSIRIAHMNSEEFIPDQEGFRCIGKGKLVRAHMCRACTKMHVSRHGKDCVISDSSVQFGNALENK